MSFNSLSYILFLPLAVIINFVLPRRFRYIWLFAASCFFYLSNSRYLGIPLLFCISVTYVVGLLLGRVSVRSKRVLLAIGIFSTLLMLLFVRFSPLQSLFIPIGVSFYSLQAIGYLADVYRGSISPERNPVRYGLFVCFFPSILSGPIQRSTSLLVQIREGRDFDAKKARSGLYCLLYGYLLKLLVANRLAQLVDYAYDSYDSMPGATLLWAAVLYSIQLYCDFAGYSALAIGTGKLFGFDMPENFVQPYFSSSIREFWNRWHVSLSSWLRDYVYIPLGGSRAGSFRTGFNLIVTFIVSGLWHGNGLTYLVWGLLHGVYQVLGRFSPHRRQPAHFVKLRTLMRVPATFSLVTFAWIFFRADSLQMALSVCRRILFHFELQSATYYGSYLLGSSKAELLLLLLSTFLVLLIDLLHERHIYLAAVSQKRIPVFFRWIFYVALSMLIIWVLVYRFGQNASTFIYERF